MATEQIPLIFFKPVPGVEPMATAQAFLNGSAPSNVVPLDPSDILQAIRKTRGFARLKIALPSFSLDNPRLGAAFEGDALPAHLHVRFFGDFDKVAEPLFDALIACGLVCYSVWDKLMLAAWPESEEPTFDRGFGARMTRILQRKSHELRETVPDEKRRSRILDAFVNSPEFRAELAREARRESPGRGKKAFADVVNCYARWRKSRASAAELIAVRKLEPRYAAMSIAELRAHIGDSPRLLVATASAPRHAAELQRSAEKLGVAIDIEAP